MHNIFKKIRRIFNQWSYHDNGKHVINYTPNNKGVYGRHIDWNSLGNHIFVWLFAIIIAIAVLILAIKALIVIIFLATIVFLIGAIWVLGKILAFQNSMVNHVSTKNDDSHKK